MLPTNIQTLKQSELGCCHTFTVVVQQKAKGNCAGVLYYLLLNLCWPPLVNFHWHQQPCLHLLHPKGCIKISHNWLKIFAWNSSLILFPMQSTTLAICNCLLTLGCAICLRIQQSYSAQVEASVGENVSLKIIKKNVMQLKQSIAHDLEILWRSSYLVI